MPLNNEIDIITVGGVDQDLRDTYTRAGIGVTEPLTVASHAYSPHEVFWSGPDRKLYEVIDDIAIGDTFTPDVNVQQKPLSDLLYRLFAQSPENIMDILSNYERTANASKNYVIGDKIIWTDGVYYKVSATVTVGTAWEVGTNIVPEDNMSDLITNLERTKDGKKVLTENLSAGSTTVTFTDNAITNDSLLEVYTSIYGVSPKTMTQSGTTVTLTFKAQESSMVVKLVIREE